MPSAHADNIDLVVPDIAQALAVLRLLRPVQLAKSLLLLMVSRFHVFLAQLRLVVIR
jgi:ABC-type spermidine/putrescine transport system permease subunit II